MSPLRLNSTVRQWVVTHPETAPVFEQLRIDYCCGGDVPLERACWDRQLDPRQVVKKLEDAIHSDSAPAAEDWSRAGIKDLCDHIERTHHAWLWRELPRLDALMDKVVRAHGASHPELVVLQKTFAELRAELEPHMAKEEEVLFPAIRALDSAGPEVFVSAGNMRNPIRSMELEHEEAGEALARIRQLTRDFQVPRDACPSYAAMLEGLRGLEADMHQHVHKENNILFPRALELEDALIEA